MAVPVKTEKTDPEPLSAETLPREFPDLRTISFIPPGPEAFLDSKISPGAEIRQIDPDEDHDGTYQGGLLFDLSEK